jgi:hypothetical protein
LICVVLVFLLRIPERKEKTTISLSKFSFLLMNYLYLDAEFYDKLVEDARKLDQEELYRFMIREINKTKESKEINDKLLFLFREFKLIDYCKVTYAKSNSDRKLKLIEDFMLLPFHEIQELMTPLLTSNFPIQVKLAAIRSLSHLGLANNDIQILLTLSSFPESSNQEIADILYHLSQIRPLDTISNPSIIDTNVQPILSNRFISLLFQPDTKECIAGAYMIGYLRVKSCSRFLVERLASSEAKEEQIVILIALRKVNDIESSIDLYQFLVTQEKLETDVIRECLTTLNQFGLVGKRFIEKLTTSQKPILKVMSKSFLSQT